MDTESRKRGRPPADGVARSKQLSFPATPDERQYIIDAANLAGVPLTHFQRDSVLAAADAIFQSQSEGLRKSPKANFQVQKSAPSIAKPQQNQLDLEKARTRERAGAEELRIREEKEIPDSSVSLRSTSQAAPVSDEEPWDQPEQLKQTIKLSTGQAVTNTWLFANGTKLPADDVMRLMETVSLKQLRKAMLQCFARSLRDCYRARWCSAYKRKMNAWHDTARSNQAFLGAAKYLAIEYARRGMTPNQFIDACDEMRPKAVRFVPVDMMSGAIGARVADWIPPEQRDRDKPWTSHVDQSGSQWITPHGEAPVVVLRSAADRERFLQQHKVR